VPHYSLGIVLNGQRKFAEAEISFRQAIHHNPKHADAQYNLAYALEVQGKLPEAIATYRAAVTIKPDYAEAYCNLGGLLKHEGRFVEALAAYGRGHELGSPRPGWTYPSAKWVQEAELLAAQEARLEASLQGKAQPADTAERMKFAWLCQRPHKQLNAAAARFYAEAFAADPKLAEDPIAAHRYNAACAAALAAAGLGRDAAQLKDDERARWRKLALDWLRTDLNAHTKRLQEGKPEDQALARQQLAYWLRDEDLIGIREPAALAKLASAEQKECTMLWQEVRMRLAQARREKEKRDKTPTR
jgi:serine/threonine-protein kinase